MTDGNTGQEAIYSKYDRFEMIFHVSTLMPFSLEDTQQIQRKRHIGNDIVTLVYLEGAGAQFDASIVKSRFLHVFILVQKEGQGWRVNVCRDENVPYFGPSLPESAMFYDPIALSTFLYQKSIKISKNSDKWRERIVQGIKATEAADENKADSDRRHYKQ